jgi:adenosylcobinamide-GDP ribazoletransferase
MRLTDLPAAFVLLTRLPAGRFIRPDAPADLARCVWAFPVVGLAVNATGGLIYWLGHAVGMPPLLAAAWALATMMIATGAFHEDGLADTADGFGGGAGPVRKMEIMRDSRIGSFGTLALLLSTIMRIAAIAALDKPLPVMTAMIAAGMLGRSGMIVVLMTAGPARGDGLGSSMATPPAGSAALGLGIAIIAALMLLPTRSALAAILFGFGACFGLARLAHAQIGGQTGDILGAAEVVTECVVVTVAASAVL